MVNNRPFIKKFKTNTNNYIYDVNTNKIIQVDEITYEIIDFYGVLSLSQISQKLKLKYSEETIKSRMDLIENAIKNNGLFSSFRPVITTPLSNRGELADLYNSRLQQLTLNVTDQCNMRCRYCVYSGKYYFKRRHSSKFMNFKTARKAIDFFFAHNQDSDHRFVNFYGGEPLLNFDLIKKCIEYIKETYRDRKTDFGLTTNGTLLTSDIIRYCVNNTVSMLVSLDGPKEIHDAYRVFKNDKGSFDIIVDNLEKIMKYDKDYYNSKVGFSMVFAPPYDLDKVYHFLCSWPLISYRDPLISFVSEGDTNFFDDIDLSKSKREETYRRMMDKYIALRTDGRTKNQRAEIKLPKALFETRVTKIKKRKMSRLPKNWIPTGACIPGVRKLFVSSKGDFYMCEKLDHSLPIGNVENGIDFTKIFNLMADYYSLMSDCDNCWALRLCPICFFIVEKGGRFDRQRKRKRCEMAKQAIEESLNVYCSILEKNPAALDYMKDVVMM